MKKFFLIIAAALTAATSCQKNDTILASSEIKYNPIDLTLTASIKGEAGTKVSYTDESNVLKAAWESGDKISLVALNASGKVLSNDVFSATGSGSSAQFSGTYSNPNNASSVAIYYPALTEGNGTDSNPWAAKKSDSYQLYPILYDLKINQNYISVGGTYNLQKKNADPSFLKDAVVMRGEISNINSLTSGTASAELKNCCYVIKMKIKVPSSFSNAQHISLTTTDPISISGWTYVNTNFEVIYGNRYNYLSIGLGNSLIKDTKTGTGILIDEDYITAYLVGYTAKSFNLTSGKTLTVSIDNYPEYTKTQTLTSDITLEPGKMYRMNIDMTK